MAAAYGHSAAHEVRVEVCLVLCYSALVNAFRQCFVVERLENKLWLHFQTLVQRQ